MNALLALWSVCLGWIPPLLAILLCLPLHAETWMCRVEWCRQWPGQMVWDEPTSTAPSYVEVWQVPGPTTGPARLLAVRPWWLPPTAVVALDGNPATVVATYDDGLASEPITAVGTVLESSTDLRKWKRCAVINAGWPRPPRFFVRLNLDTK